MENNKRKFTGNENGPSKKQKTDNNHIITRELWINSGDLNHLFKGNNDIVDYWKVLASDLTQYCKDNPGELNSGLLIMPPLEITRDNIGSTIKDTTNVSKTHKFIKDFMSKNGQLEYIANSEWFKNGEWKIAVDINFYPNRDFQKDSNELVVHKDRYCKNLFVNLIFDNTTRILGTEWTLDDLERDNEWNAILNDVLPKELVSQLENARESMKTIEDKTYGKGYWESSILEPFGYVSFINELIWHSTPAALPRKKFSELDLLELFNEFSSNPKNTDYNKDSFVFLYEAILIAYEVKSDDLSKLNNFQESLKNINSFIVFLVNAKPQENELLIEVIKSIDWGQYKITGLIGQYAKDSNNNNEFPIGKNSKDRRNSLDARQSEIIKVLAEMKDPKTGKLLKRSFIRTWVTLKKV